MNWFVLVGCTSVPSLNPHTPLLQTTTLTHPPSVYTLVHHVYTVVGIETV